MKFASILDDPNAGFLVVVRNLGSFVLVKMHEGGYLVVCQSHLTFTASRCC